MTAKLAAIDARYALRLSNDNNPDYLVMDNIYEKIKEACMRGEYAIRIPDRKFNTAAHQRLLDLGYHVTAFSDTMEIGIYWGET